MKSHRLILLYICIVLLVATECKAKGPLTFFLPNEWMVEYEYYPSRSRHVYNVYQKGDDPVSLMFWTGPREIQASLLQSTVNKEVDFYLSKVKEKQKIDPKFIKVEKVRIQGREFSGYSVILYHSEDHILNLFSTHNNNLFLRGQYVGSEEKMKNAIRILESIKYNG